MLSLIGLKVPLLSPGELIVLEHVKHLFEVCDIRLDRCRVLLSEEAVAELPHRADRGSHGMVER